MSERIRAFDWSRTPLGPMESWSPALRMMVRFLLANRFPLLLWWGPQYVSIYNDAYCPILGTKHPGALGQRVNECWSEIWHILQPLIDTPFQGGPATWNDDISLELNRHGFLEETHFTIAYSPVPDEIAPNGIGGVIATVHEITEKVVGERRGVALREIGARVSEAKTAEDACATAARSLAAHDKDVPFALFYLFDADGKHARLVGAVGASAGQEISPAVIALGQSEGTWPLAQARGSEAMQVVEGLSKRFAHLPPGPWSDAPTTAVVVSIPSNKPNEPAGAMVAGVSSRLKLDAFYRDFFELLRTQVASAITSARAYEEERKRAEALAEIDRTKTEFFSNVSHELRTPLTLMLGPIEEELRSEPKNSGLKLAHRNSLRLLKLVNTLLDFSRIEAGRLRASYEPTDLSALTSDLASTFRSAIENAGVKLSLDCPALPEPVYVDPEMWEKVILNLLSNALKFTFAGEIKVQLRELGDRVELSVADTGTGIPADALPHLFERFYRVRDARSRTHEGTGIGLALVQELVRLHGGEVRVESKVGVGTTFTISLQTGTLHLPKDRIGAPRMQQSTALGATPFVEEALRWLPESAGTSTEPASGAAHAKSDPLAKPAESPNKKRALPRVILADDNADMREYVGRLLRERYEVIAVPDGVAALDAARAELPDLILSDVMMPRLDGFGLVREIRSDANTRSIPVILISARAGEESRVEGLSDGADDYLVKPFSARELMARIEAHLKLVRLRHESERRVSQILASITDGFVTIDAQWRYTQFNEAARTMFAAQGVIADSLLGKHVRTEGLPDAGETQAMSALARTMTARVPTEVQSFYKPWQRWFSVRHFPLPDGGVASFFHDITELKRAEDKLREREQELETVINSTPFMLTRCSRELRYRFVSEAYAGMIHRVPQSIVNKPIVEIIGEAGFKTIEPHIEKVLSGERTEYEADVSFEGVGVRSLHVVYTPDRDELGHVNGWIASILDVSERKRAEAALLQSDQELRSAQSKLLLHAADLETKVQERTAKLQDMVNEVQHISYAMVHDMRAPLRAMSAFVELMCESQITAEQTQDYGRRIRVAANRLDQLIQDSLRYTKLAHQEVAHGPVVLSTLILGLIETYPNLQGEQADIQIEGELPVVIGNEALLTQCFSNLLGNAVKFVSPGIKPLVRVQSEIRGNLGRIWVRDNGIGIPQHSHRRLFNMFQRIADNYEGTGIGLAIVRKVVERMNGQVGVESEAGRGSSFWVDLPLSAQSENGSPA